MLTQLLTHCHLPDLTSIDQLYLIALADTVASVDADLADCFDEMSEGSNEGHKNQGPTLGRRDCLAPKASGFCCNNAQIFYSEAGKIKKTLNCVLCSLYLMYFGFRVLLS